MNTINIEISPTIKSLTYNPYGREVYETQVKDRVDLNGVNELVFPEQVIKASSSFVQGFFAEIIDEMGVDAVSEHFVISSPNEQLKNSFREGLI